MLVQSKLKGWLVTSAYWDAGTGEDSVLGNQNTFKGLSVLLSQNRQVHLVDGPGHTDQHEVHQSRTHCERPSVCGHCSGMRTSRSFDHWNMEGKDSSGLPSDASFWVQMLTLVSGDN